MCYNQWLFHSVYKTGFMQKTSYFLESLALARMTTQAAETCKT